MKRGDHDQGIIHEQGDREGRPYMCGFAHRIFSVLELIRLRRERAHRQRVRTLLPLVR